MLLETNRQPEDILRHRVNPNLRSRRIAGVLFAAVAQAILLPACDQQSSVLEPPNTSASVLPPELDCGDIYHPCEIGGIKVVVRRQPDGPVEWPDSVPCSEIPGGCVPEDGPPILGAEPYRNYSGPWIPDGATHSGAQSATNNPTKRAQIQLAIRQIGYYDTHNVCQPIIDNLLDRLSSDGIWLYNFDNGYIGGIWYNHEGNRGSVYISTEPGINWNTDGTVDIRELRHSLTEEGIHAYFDTDVSHGQSSTEETKAAMDHMRVACGYWD